MGETFKPGCRPPTHGIKPKEKPIEQNTIEKGGGNMVSVGELAPDFMLNAYHKGEFKQFTLSEFRGKWVLLCFYPGDFTFV